MGSASLKAFGSLPAGLRDPLIDEYRSIVQNYLEHRWSPAELSGGLLCEIVYTILDGHAKGNYPSAPSKPGNFVAACRSLESNSNVPRSFQILIPRLLPALYEIRNNRGVGHVGGDVNPNDMDAGAVLSISTWVMAELVRVFHQLTPADAQRFVDLLAERRIPLVWERDGRKRVLDPKMPLRSQILVLLAPSTNPITTADLMIWLDTKDRTYFMKLLRELHRKRLVDISDDEKLVEILPPGAVDVEQLLAKRRAV